MHRKSGNWRSSLTITHSYRSFCKPQLNCRVDYHIFYNLGSKPEAKKSVQLFLLLYWDSDLPTEQVGSSLIHTQEDRNISLWISASNTLELRMLLSNFSSDQCEYFGPGCECSYAGDLAQEHVSICLPEDLCRKVKKNQKQKNMW